MTEQVHVGGIYRHYRGQLFQVLGIARDANTKDLIDNTKFYAEPLAERTVVVYIGLQLDGAHPGPRMAVRTVEDFLAEVDGNATPRFEYLGPELTDVMLVAAGPALRGDH